MNNSFDNRITHRQNGIVETVHNKSALQIGGERPSMRTVSGRAFFVPADERPSVVVESRRLQVEL